MAGFSFVLYSSAMVCAARAAALSAVSLLAACVERAPDTQSALPLGGMPTLVDSPSLVIGVVDGDPEYQFEDVAGATRRRDGTIVVADRGTSSLRFYDALGKFVRKSGRNGGGPGEYHMLGDFIPLESGYLVSDWRLPRISLLDLNGKYLRSITAPETPIMEVEGYENGIAHYRYDLIGEVPPNLLAVRVHHPGMRSFRYGPNVVFRDTIVYVTLNVPNRDAGPLEIVDSIATALGGTIATRMRATPNGSLIQVAYYVHFTAWPAVAIARDRIYVADSDSFLIRAYDLRGNLVQTIREERGLEPVTGEDIAADKARMAGDNRDEAGRPFASSETQKWVNWYFDNIPLPKTKPARSRLVVDGNQNLWVQDFSILADARRGILIDTPIGDDGRWWTVFDRQGVKLGRIELPKGLEVLEIGSDYLLGLAVDDLDVQTIVLYRITGS
jgi:hypothetical protein